VASEAIAQLLLEHVLNSQLGYERFPIWACISNKWGYEGNAAFHIGKRGEAGAMA
jgi:hypothetical protein